MSIKALEKSH